VRHETFKNVALGEAFDAIEGSILPSLTMLIEAAATAQPGADAAARAQELRAIRARARGADPAVRRLQLSPMIEA
jgi:hypothetical protein